jgi:hypothetical protein
MLVHEVKGKTTLYPCLKGRGPFVDREAVKKL